jgi:hypothetical protein
MGRFFNRGRDETPEEEVEGSQSADERWLLSLPPQKFGIETKRRAMEAYAVRDWQMIYDWTKSWMMSGGGVWMVDAWLLYVISSLLQGWPRSAVHSVDMALGTWIEAPEDRAILHWVRAAVIHRRMNDPKTAIHDYEAASAASPGWLREQLASDLASCAADAERSRKRKPSVDPAPEFWMSPGIDRDKSGPPTESVEPGSIPSVWFELLETLHETTRDTGPKPA